MNKTNLSAYMAMTVSQLKKNSAWVRRMCIKVR